MIKRLSLGLLVGACLLFGTAAQAAAPSSIISAQDLFDTCADQSATAQAACVSYVHATVQTAEIMHAADNGGKLTPLFCPGDQMVAQDFVAVLHIQATAHPERMKFPAPTVIIGGSIDAYPCSKPTAASAAAPAQKSARRKPHH